MNSIKALAALFSVVAVALLISACDKKNNNNQACQGSCPAGQVQTQMGCASTSGCGQCMGNVGGQCYAANGYNGNMSYNGYNNGYNNGYYNNGYYNNYYNNGYNNYYNQCPYGTYYYAGRCNYYWY